jgi:hypothetical protein
MMRMLPLSAGSGARVTMSATRPGMAMLRVLRVLWWMV